jgi:molecular chaperone IbpA
MTRLTSTDLTNVHRHALGADRIITRILDSIENQNGQHGNYPPYNIIKLSETETEVQVAVAGFNITELEVKIENGLLIISGEKALVEESTEVNYVHHGISARKFIRTWTLADNVEVLDANVKDGILNVRVQRLIPDIEKPKSIPITYAS